MGTFNGGVFTNLDAPVPTLMDVHEFRDALEKSRTKEEFQAPLQALTKKPK